MLNFKKEFLYALSKFSTLGAYPFHVLIAFLFFKLDYVQESVFLFAGFVLMYALGVPLRFILFKKRKHPKNQDKFLAEWHPSSFPSFHAARITFLALFYVQFFGYNLENILFALAITGLVSWARVLGKNHYTSDVLGGIVLGTLVWVLLTPLIPF